MCLSVISDYKRSGLHPIPAQQYDSEAFDSMAVMNSEIWNLEEGEESELSAADLLPNVRPICNVYYEVYPSLRAVSCLYDNRIHSYFEKGQLVSRETLSLLSLTRFSCYRSILSVLLILKG